MSASPHGDRPLHKLARFARMTSAPPNGKRLVAMGDSWFNYLPHYDIMWWLQAKHGYACRSVAVIGDTLTCMARPPNWDPKHPPQLKPKERGHQLADLARVLRDEFDDDDKKEVAAFLISGGGNDIAGEDSKFGDLLNQAGSPKPLNEALLKKRVDVDLRAVLEDVLSAVDELATLYLERPVPIYLHGYAYPVPDGRPGPTTNWLKPAFDAKRYTDRQQCTDIMKTLIDRLNDMQINVARKNKLASPVHHVDLRTALSNDLTDNRYQVYWQNELHPTIPRGFQLVSDLFAIALDDMELFTEFAQQWLYAAPSTPRKARSAPAPGSSPR